MPEAEVGSADDPTERLGSIGLPQKSTDAVVAPVIQSVVQFEDRGPSPSGLRA